MSSLAHSQPVFVLFQKLTVPEVWFTNYYVPKERLNEIMSEEDIENWRTFKNTDAAQNRLWECVWVYKTSYVDSPGHFPPYPVPNALLCATYVLIECSWWLHVDCMLNLAIEKPSYWKSY